MPAAVSAADAIFDCGVGRRWTTCVADGFCRSVLRAYSVQSLDGCVQWRS
jgi:hypothetical protein